MCRQNSPVHHSGDEDTAADESLLIYCKPVELYNILYRRSLHNPSFLRRSLRYKIKARRKRSSAETHYSLHFLIANVLIQTFQIFVTFIHLVIYQSIGLFMQGLRFHLCSSHDLFNFEFWVTDDYQAVNVSVKIDILRSELCYGNAFSFEMNGFFVLLAAYFVIKFIICIQSVADGVNPQSQTFIFCSRPRKRLRKDSVQNEKRANVKFLELDSPEGTQNGFLEKNDDILSYKGENMSKTCHIQKNLQMEKQGVERFGPNVPGTADCLEYVASSFNIQGVSIAMPQSSGDPETSKSVYRSDPAVPAKTKKLNMDRSDSKKYVLRNLYLAF
ncbi:hypothetical protein Ahy_Scaffold1g107080 isoform B [Arachis hypogaea]|uniref:Polycomb protein SUZ12-like zinc finger domain-containing protein n=1 Tax=Arachis hypogaea TaxID=3818 RepID=A0A444WUI4_ARAHY|nr:hypothetical protein Ahy_Scaffold1g107080 isoform B [Arachis hypogaea]